MTVDKELITQSAVQRAATEAPLLTFESDRNN